MTEVTGGTFWKKYTPGQIAGTEEFPPIKDIQDVPAMAELMQYYPPINLYLIINNSLSKETVVEIPKKAERYTLSAQNMRSSVVQMNGKELVVSGIADIPELIPVQQKAGPVTLAPGSCTFLVM